MNYFKTMDFEMMDCQKLKRKHIDKASKKNYESICRDNIFINFWIYQNNLRNDICEYLFWCDLIILAMCCKDLYLFIQTMGIKVSRIFEEQNLKFGYYKRFETIRIWKGIDLRNGSDYISELSHIAYSEEDKIIQKNLIGRLRDKASVLKNAAKYGNLEILIYLINRKSTKYLSTSPILCIEAASTEQLTILKWLREHNYPWNSDVPKEAALNGHLETLKWAIENECDYNKYKMSEVSTKGHLHIIKWMFDNDINFEKQIAHDNAIRYGHLNILNFYKEKQIDIRWSLYDLAIQCNQLKVIKWAHENVYKWTRKNFLSAGEKGNIEIIKYMHKNGCYLDIDFCGTIVLMANLELLKWARENKCPWDENTFYWATQSSIGQDFPNDLIKILNYLKENNCPWDERTIIELSNHKSPIIQNWIIENQFIK